MSKIPAKQQQVIGALMAAAGPRSASELWEDLRATGVGIATIYRALKSGLDAGELKALEMPGAPVRYEPVGRKHHHHFLCSICKRAFDIKGCVDGIERVLPKGFAMAGHEILFSGTCTDCGGVA